MRLIALFVVLTALVQSAHGQGGPWASPFETPFRTEIDSEALGMAESMMALSDAQAASLQQMAADHRAKVEQLEAHWKPIADDFARRISSLPDRSLSAFNVELERERALRRAADEQAARCEAFIRGIATILAEPQMSGYDRWVRWLNRRRWLGKSADFPESAVDLVRFVNAFAAERTLDLDTTVQAALLQYELRMDAALRDYVAYRISLARVWLERDLGRYQNDGHVVWMGRGTDADLRRSRREAEEIKNGVTKIRDAAHEGRLMVQSSLPPDEGVQFEASYLQQVLRPYIDLDALPLQTYATHVMEIESLSAEQRNAVVAMLDAHRAQQRAAEKAILAAANAAVSGRYEGSTREREQLAQALEHAVLRRKTIDEPVIKNIDSVLDPAQRAGVPSPSGSHQSR